MERCHPYHCPSYLIIQKNISSSHTIRRPNGEVEFLTKGDNNRVDDRGLYASGQMWLERKDVLGRARGVLRYAGMVVSD